MALGWTIAICIIVGLLIGYAIGHLQHKENGEAAREAVRAHDDYRAQVNEHFEQSSKIMSRMVDDYREMYQHLSAGAGKLANIHPERVVTPPPAPEAITAQDENDDPAAAHASSQRHQVAEDATADSDEAKAGHAATATTADAELAGADDSKATESAPATADAASDDESDGAHSHEDVKARARRLSGNPA